MIVLTLRFTRSQSARFGLSLDLFTNSNLDNGGEVATSGGMLCPTPLSTPVLSTDTTRDAAPTVHPYSPLTTPSVALVSHYLGVTITLPVVQIAVKAL